MASAFGITSGPSTQAFRANPIDTNPWRDQMSTDLMGRPGWGKLGKPANIAINSHIVRSIPSRSIFQYDVSLQYPRSHIQHHSSTNEQVCIGSGAEKRGLIKVVSQTKAFKEFVGTGFIFDGNAIGW